MAPEVYLIMPRRTLDVPDLGPWFIREIRAHSRVQLLQQNVFNRQSLRIKYDYVRGTEPSDGVI